MYKKWPILDGYAPSGHPGECFIQRNSKFEEAYIFSPLWQDFSDPYAMRYTSEGQNEVVTDGQPVWKQGNSEIYNIFV